MPLVILASFILGTIIGSFLNVVTLRLGKSSIVHGRSHCPHCKKTLSPLELIPVFSYAILRGRCAGCRKGISIQYPLVEFATGASFAYLAYALPQPLSLESVALFVSGAVIISLFVAIAVYDFHHTIVPDVLVYPLALISLATLFFDSSGAISMPTWAALGAGPILALPFALLWSASKGRWIGLGDAKIALPMGWLLGITAGFTAVAVAFWTGAIVALSILLVSRLRHGHSALTMKSEVPFAPFLIFGTAVVYVSGINFFFVL